jgi:phage-related protein
VTWRVEILNDTVAAERVIVVRAFVKKTQRTPPAEIKLALRRAKEIT